MQLEGLNKNKGYANIKYDNEFELVNVYVEHTIDKPNMVEEAKLGHDYDDEVLINGDCGPNSDDDEVGVGSDSVNVDEVEAGSDHVNDDEVEVGSDNVNKDEVQKGSDNVVDEVQK
ncbi:unnamed protein product [Vicia faba]|uniref:Uncharacterized protein n=1 Tax=Vicia faba TaxID=3906 RepID=A0AAV0YM77_VICFA|nr:unnamed protein product [Vicia faba]